MKMESPSGPLIYGKAECSAKSNVWMGDQAVTA